MDMMENLLVILPKIISVSGNIRLHDIHFCHRQLHHNWFYWRWYLKYKKPHYTNVIVSKTTIKPVLYLGANILFEIYSVL